MIVTVFVALGFAPSQAGPGEPQLSGSPRSVTRYVNESWPVAPGFGVYEKPGPVPVRRPFAGPPTISYCRLASPVSTSETSAPTSIATAGPFSCACALPSCACGTSFTGATVVETVPVSVPSWPSESV